MEEQDVVKIELPDQLLDLLSELEIPSEGAQFKRMGSYKVLQLAEGAAINKAQLRELLSHGLVALSPAKLKLDLIFSQNSF